MDVTTVRFDPRTKEALQAKAAAEQVPESELVRRYVRTGLGLAAGDDTGDVLAALVRSLLREELRPVRRLAYLAAREATLAKHWSRGHAAMYVENTYELDEDAATEWLKEQDATAGSKMMRVLRERDPERSLEQGDDAGEEAEGREGEA